LLNPELGFGSDSENFSLIAVSGYKTYISLLVDLINVGLYFLIAYYQFKYFREINIAVKTRNILDLENTIAAQSSF